MADVTQILDAAAAGDPKAAAELLPLVYDELRKLAAARLVEERPGQTLQATALVHEAYLRLVGGEQPPDWNSRGHFFPAAAEAMRRILIEIARRRTGPVAGGRHIRVELSDVPAELHRSDLDLLALDHVRLAQDARDVDHTSVRVARAGAVLGVERGFIRHVGHDTEAAGRLWERSTELAGLG